MEKSDLPAHIDLSNLPHTAHLKGSVMSMGLKRIDELDWLGSSSVNTAAYAANKINRSRELGSRALAVTPGCAAAVAELSALIEASTAVATEPCDEVCDQLYKASLTVPEDLCLLLPGENGFVLAGAHLCAPSHWCLEDKIGRSLDPIHAPVPGYEGSLARSVNRFLEKLAPEQFIERYNWSLDVEPELCQRPPREGAARAGALAWYRTERQTLRRLPNSGAIVFGILVQQWPLWHLARRAEDKALLLQAIEQLTPALRDYKNFGGGRRLDWSKP